jgi:aspartokinase-like uncharacterized kinase
MLVVKIGGSLYNTPELKKWLSVLTKSSKHHKVIIVPGGGPFADTVRKAQKDMHISDSSAHHMAILAMAQYGLLLNALAPSSQLFYYPSSDDLTSVGLSIWIPTDSLLNNKAIPHQWNVTSDSLALWLAQQINADQLCLIKRVRVHSCSITALTEATVIDDAFSQFFSANPIEAYIQYYQDFASFELAQRFPKRLYL